MIQNPGRFLAPALVGFLLSALAVAEAEEEKHTEVLTIARVEAQQALLAVRTLAGTREIEAVAAHQLSIHDTAERLLLARKVIEMLDRPDEVRLVPNSYDVGDGTMLGCAVVVHVPARDAMRMLMSEIGIRKVALVKELETVIFRDSPDQVGKAFQLLSDFDRPKP